MALKRATSLMLASLLSPFPEAQSVSSFLNPILPGPHPDPSCVHVSEEETFYCASSTFNIFPGIPIHASKDLVSWRLVGHALNRPSQLPILSESVGSTSGLWAPTLRHHNGTFYVITTMVHDKNPENDPKRWDNIIFSTKDIWDESSWSDAVHFDFQGYDPSPWWDDDGASYIVGAHAYRVSPGIHLAQVDLVSGEVQSEWMNVWNGTGGLAPEGPHIYHKDGYYYLLVAEGGTGKDHMVTMARSRHLYGPYEANPANPVLTNANTTEYFQAVGHADLLQDKRGAWWAVALAVRSGPEYITYPMGRETVLTNVSWDESEWPVFQKPVLGEMTGWELPGDDGKSAPGDGPMATDGDKNITFGPGSALPPQFVYWRPPVPESYTISPEGHPNTLRLTPSKLNLTGLDGNSNGPGGQTFIARRQIDTLFRYSVDIDFRPSKVEEETGVSLFLSQNHHARLGVALLPGANSSNPHLHFRFHAISYIAVPPSFDTPVPASWGNQTLTFEIKAVNSTHYSFAAGPARDEALLNVLAYAQGEIISWGFTGALLGVYATANGGNGTTPAYVSNWNYMGLGQVRDRERDVI